MHDKRVRVRAAAAVKAERKERAGLTRTLKLRLYPTDAQAGQVNRTIGTLRYVWNTLWLPMVEAAARERGNLAERNGGTAEAWREAWRLHPDPSETDYNGARKTAAKAHAPWIAEALQTPLTRASRSFALAVKASRGRTQSGAVRKARVGRIKPRSRRDDTGEGLEWQLSGNAPLGGRPLAGVVVGGSVKVPVLGLVTFKDKGRLVRSYIERGAEACELTVKRQGTHYYACIAVRGLQPLADHPCRGSAIGLDMGVVNPLADSNGRLVTHHQGYAIAAHLARLQRKKLRVERQLSRKRLVAAQIAGAVTETGGFKKGVRIPTSNRMRRANERATKIDRQIVGYRADWQRKQALAIMQHSEIVVVEALAVQNMTRSAAGSADKPGRNVRAKAALNRAVLARGWGSMRQRLKNKAQELAGQVIEVDPRYTSQACPECGHTEKANRATQAEFVCRSCGMVEHADTVGARNILARGLSAGVQPAAGRGGCATDAVPSGAVSERAVEASNKSSREPVASGNGVAGSRGAKPHIAPLDGSGSRNVVATRAGMRIESVDLHFACRIEGCAGARTASREAEMEFWMTVAAVVLSVTSLLLHFLRDRNARHVRLLERSNQALRLCHQATMSYLAIRKDLQLIVRSGNAIHIDRIRLIYGNVEDLLERLKHLKSTLESFGQRNHTGHAARLAVENLFSEASGYAEVSAALIKHTAEWLEIVTGDDISTPA